MSFFKLDFVAKFLVQNKESFEKLILKNLHIEARGMKLTNMLKDKAHSIDLQVIHIDNVNLNEKGLKHLIVNCKKMSKLKEFSLVKMPVVKEK